jgi:hypothetical protein
MKKSLGMALLALALVLVPAGTAAKRKVWPDLVVTNVVIRQLPGEPPYVIEDEQGHTPGFAAFVTIRNIGKATAKPSTTELEFTRLSGRRIWGSNRHLPPLRPKATHVLRYAVNLERPPLGVLVAQAKADVSHVVTETNEGNNDRRARTLLPVVAKQWKALDFMTTENLGGAGFPGALETNATKVCAQVDCGRYFLFRFSTFDEASKRFEYIPSGTVRASASYVYAPLSCTGQGNAIYGPYDWPKDSLWIDDQLDHYEASVNTEAAAPATTPFWVTCMGTPILQNGWGWQTLLTFVGEKQYPSMDSPYSTRLTGHTEKTAGGTTTTWQWTFQADVPGA